MPTAPLTLRAISRRKGFVLGLVRLNGIEWIGHGQLMDN